MAYAVAGCKDLGRRGGIASAFNRCRNLGLFGMRGPATKRCRTAVRSARNAIGHNATGTGAHAHMALGARRGTRVGPEHVAAVHLRALARAERAASIAPLLPTGAFEARTADTRELDILGRNLVEEARTRVGLGGTVRAARGCIGEEQALAGARDGHVRQAALLLELGGIVVGPAGDMREDALLHARHKHDRELQALGGVHRHHGDGVRVAGQRIQVGAEGEPLEQRRQGLACEWAVGALDFGRRNGCRVGTGRRRGAGVRKARSRTGCHHAGRPRRPDARSGHSSLGHIGHAGLTQLLQALKRALDILVRLLELSGDTQELLDVLGAALGLHGALGAEGGNQAALVHDGIDHVLELAVHAAPLAHDVHEVAQRGADLCREHARLGASQLACLEERAHILPCQVLDLTDRSGADTAARRVDHALDAHLVRRVHDHLKVRHDIADLGTVEESRAAHDLVRHARA